MDVVVSENNPEIMDRLLFVWSKVLSWLKNTTCTQELGRRTELITMCYEREECSRETTKNGCDSMQFGAKGIGSFGS